MVRVYAYIYIYIYDICRAVSKTTGNPSASAVFWIVDRLPVAGGGVFGTGNPYRHPIEIQ